jgi:hypothetical protein
MLKPTAGASVLIVATLLVNGCATQQNSTRIDYQMGERVTVGSLTYNVIESAWRSQLGTEYKVRMPENRYLMINISVTNGAGKELSVPLLELENANGQTFHEVENGEGVSNWFGVLRTLNPAQTQQGRLLYDVPLSGYKLRLPDGSGTGVEKYAWVEIPLRMDPDNGVDGPGMVPITPTIH